MLGHSLTYLLPYIVAGGIGCVDTGSQGGNLSCQVVKFCLQAEVCGVQVSKWLGGHTGDVLADVALHVCTLSLELWAKERIHTGCIPLHHLWVIQDFPHNLWNVWGLCHLGADDCIKLGGGHDLLQHQLGNLSSCRLCSGLCHMYGFSWVADNPSLGYSLPSRARVRCRGARSNNQCV